MTTSEKISQTNKNCPAIPRLGIHAYGWWSEGLHGIARNGIATVFPQAIAMAATWDPALHEQVADVIATEARSKYNATIARTGGDTHIYQGITIWSPNINIFRDPRWGRGQETYGEDPFLTGCLGAAFIRGLQGDDPHYLKTVGTLKHFVAHSGPEDVRQKFNSVVSIRDLRETYLPAFEYGVRHAHPASVMTSYNEFNGVPMPCNRPLLENILRAEWGFSGAVVGDVDNVADVWPVDRHHYTDDAAEASALSIKAGNDLCGGNTYDHGLPDALKRGLLTEADLDVALRRLFLLRFKLGQFDPPERVPYSKIPPAACDTPAEPRTGAQGRTRKPRPVEKRRRAAVESGRPEARRHPRPDRGQRRRAGRQLFRYALAPRDDPQRSPREAGAAGRQGDLRLRRSAGPGRGRDGRSLPDGRPLFR